MRTKEVEEIMAEMRKRLQGIDDIYFESCSALITLRAFDLNVLLDTIESQEQEMMGEDA
jgi:hypothetical protein